MLNIELGARISSRERYSITGTLLQYYIRLWENYNRKQKKKKGKKKKYKSGLTEMRRNALA